VCDKLDCSNNHSDINTTNQTSIAVMEDMMLPNSSGSWAEIVPAVASNRSDAANNTDFGSQISSIEMYVPPIKIQYANASSCRTGYAGALCGACDVGWVMTKDGCISCAADSMFKIVLLVGVIAILAFALYKLLVHLQHKLKQAKDDDSESSSDEEGEGNDRRARAQTLRPDHEMTSKERIAAAQRKMRLVKHLAGFRLSLEMQSAAREIGTEELKSAQEDAKKILDVMSKGAGRSKTSMKIAVGLTQILGEMPSVLDLKYPEGFVGFIDSLSFIQFDMFQIFKVDCLATTDIYTKFLATMSFPVILVLIVEIRMHYKVRSLRSEVWENKGKPWKGDPVVSLHEKRIRNTRTSIYKESQRVQSQEKANRKIKGVLYSKVVDARAAALANHVNWDEHSGGAKHRHGAHSEEAQHAREMQMRAWEAAWNERQQLWLESSMVQETQLALKQANKDVFNALVGSKQILAIERQTMSRSALVNARAKVLVNHASWEERLHGITREATANEMAERDLKRDEIAMTTADADMKREVETERRHLALFKKKFEPRKAKLLAATAGLRYAVVFFLYPMLSRTVFRMWLCRELDYGERWHVDQYAIDCNAPKHKLFELLAFLFALLYPIGIPLYFFAAMWKVRQHLKGEAKAETINQVCQTDPEITEYTGDVFQDVSRSATKTGKQLANDIARQITKLRERLTGAQEGGPGIPQMRLRPDDGASSRQQIEEEQAKHRAEEQSRLADAEHQAQQKAYRRRREAVHGRAQDIEVSVDNFFVGVDDSSDNAKAALPGTPPGDTKNASPTRLLGMSTDASRTPAKSPCTVALLRPTSRASPLDIDMTRRSDLRNSSPTTSKVLSSDARAIQAMVKKPAIDGAVAMTTAEIEQIVEHERPPSISSSAGSGENEGAPPSKTPAPHPPATPRTTRAPARVGVAASSPALGLLGESERALTMGAEDIDDFDAVELATRAGRDDLVEDSTENLALSRRLQGGTGVDESSDEDEDTGPRRTATSKFVEDVCYHCKQPGHWKINCPLLLGTEKVQMRVQNGRAVKIYKFDRSAVSGEVEISAAEEATARSVSVRAGLTSALLPYPHMCSHHLHIATCIHQVGRTHPLIVTAGPCCTVVLCYAGKDKADRAKPIPAIQEESADWLDSGSRDVHFC
jgi:hypothetical protein